MIKFILHWWVTSVPSDSNMKFYQTIVNSIWWKWKILQAPFGAKYLDRNNVFDIDIEKFKKYTDTSNLKFTMAEKNVEILTRQIKESDVIYVRWWTTDWVLKVFQRINNLKDLLQNKVVAWSSAWSIMWTKYFFDQDTYEICDWLWFIQAKAITHFWGYPDDDKSLIELKNYKEDLPIYAIKEQEFIELNID